MTISDRSFQRLVLAAMAAGFVLLMTAGIAAVITATRNQDNAALVAHTYATEGALAEYGVLSERIEAVRRGYLLLQDDKMAAKINPTLARMPPLLGRIDALTSDNPMQQRRARLLRAIGSAHETSVARTFNLMHDHDSAAQLFASFGVDDSIAAMDKLRAVLKEMNAEEARLLVTRNADQVTSTRAMYVTLAVTGVLIITVMGAALAVILRYTADLNRSQDALRDLNAGLEIAVAERTAELSRANDEIQRFAYIVSHDLRSPLVNVMGFTAELETAIAPLTTLIDRVDAEAPGLMTPDARAAKADLPEAIGFIRTSTAKMDLLINSILRLSREGRRRLTPAPVDLPALIASIRDGFRHRIDEIGAEIVIGTPMPPIVSDRLALEQIVSNLVENALKYLSSGRPGRVVVSARTEGKRVIIDVADNGRGVAPADHERIFDLFRRSGVQDQPGEGLGLAHVRALTYRLGGLITCISDLGEGATFRLSLPEILIVEQRVVEQREGMAA